MLVFKPAIKRGKAYFHPFNSDRGYISKEMAKFSCDTLQNFACEDEEVGVLVGETGDFEIGNKTITYRSVKWVGFQKQMNGISTISDTPYLRL